MNSTSCLGGEAQQLLVMPPPKYTDQLLELALGLGLGLALGLALGLGLGLALGLALGLGLGLALGLGLGLGLTVELEIVLIHIISVDFLGHGRGIWGAKSIQFGWRMVGESPVEYNLQGVGHRWGKVHF